MSTTINIRNADQNQNAFLFHSWNFQIKSSSLPLLLWRRVLRSPAANTRLGESLDPYSLEPAIVHGLCNLLAVEQRAYAQNWQRVLNQRPHQHHTGRKDHIQMQQTTQLIPIQCVLQAPYSARYFTYIISDYSCRNIVNRLYCYLYFEDQELQSRKVEKVAQGYTVNKEESQDKDKFYSTLPCTHNTKRLQQEQM